MPAINIPSNWDAHHLASLAGLKEAWAVGPAEEEGEVIFSFISSNVLPVEQAIEDFPLANLNKRKAEKLHQIAVKRYEEEQRGPSGLTLNDKTIARLTAAALSLVIDPDKASVNWKLDAGNFVTLPREHVLGLALSSVNHVQNCFDHEEDLTADVMAITLDTMTYDAALQALDAIDINNGWPNP